MARSLSLEARIIYSKVAEGFAEASPKADDVNIDRGA